MEGHSKNFEKYLAVQNSQLPLAEFLPSIVLAIFTAWILSILYVRFGRSVTNRKSMASNFVLLTVTTMMIISVVKSSLALSLGLVGALSIVRFRAAIKEPEELCFLFVAISLGLGYGANQVLVTTVSFIIVSLIVIVRGLGHQVVTDNNFLVTLSLNSKLPNSVDSLVQIFKENSRELSIVRLDESKDLLELTLQAAVADISRLEKIKSQVLEYNSGARIIFLDNKGITA